MCTKFYFLRSTNFIQFGEDLTEIQANCFCIVPGYMHMLFWGDVAVYTRLGCLWLSDTATHSHRVRYQQKLAAQLTFRPLNIFDIFHIFEHLLDLLVKQRFFSHP